MGSARRYFPTTTCAACVAALCCALLSASAASAVTFGQLDDFSGGTTMGWRHGPAAEAPPTNVPAGGPGGPGDAYLQNRSGFAGTEPRQLMLNTDQWLGNYNAAGVTQINAQLANFGPATLNMRLFIEGAGGTRFGSTAAATLGPDGQWRSVTFNLTSDALSLISGTASLQNVLGSVSEVRILSASGGPSRVGDSVTATLGADNIRAQRLPGDANFSGAVDAADFATLAGNFGKTGQTWNAGDFTFDGRVDATDFSLLAANFGKRIPASASAPLTVEDWASLEAFGASIGASTVPEPSTLCLLALAPLLARRARRAAPSCSVPLRN
jgi:hypothetical protein